MTREEAIKELSEWLNACCGGEEIEPTKEAFRMAIEALKAQKPKHDEKDHQEQGDSVNFGSETGETCADAVSRQAAIDAADRTDYTGLAVEDVKKVTDEVVKELKQLPSVQPEPLTDKEQRIFLAAMGREEKVCNEVDRNYVREPYEDSLMSVCREIKRKVKGALWT